jgi:hypothetical protein
MSWLSACRRCQPEFLGEARVCGLSCRRAESAEIELRLRRGEQEIALVAVGVGRAEQARWVAIGG